MNFRRVVPWGLWTALLMLGFSIQAAAGTSCTGKETCSTTNTCDGGNCIVVFTRNGATVTVQVEINGSLQTILNNSYFCIQPGTMINWTTADADFFARFAPGGYPSPFTNGQNSLLGTLGNGVSLTAMTPDDDDCHSFAVATCDVSSTASGMTCGTADPKVVITGGSGMESKHRHNGKKSE